MEPETAQPTGDATSPIVVPPQPVPQSRGAKARKTRLETSTVAQRQAVARKAAKARWDGKKAFGRKSQGRNPAAVFGKALSAAENRLAEAIQERAYHSNMSAVLDAEIPSLVRTIQALKNTQEPQFSMSTAIQAASPETRLASTMGLPASPARGATLGVDLSEGADEDKFLRESDLAGGAWH